VVRNKKQIDVAYVMAFLQGGGFELPPREE
jgi:hypothetical protein